MSTGNRLTDTPPRVENLAQMLQFQDKAVVSRMLDQHRDGSGSKEDALDDALADIAHGVLGQAVADPGQVGGVICSHGL